MFRKISHATGVAALAALTLLAASPCALADAAAVKAVQALEQQQARAAIAGDRAALEALFAPDFTLVNPAGALTTRAELMALLTGGSSGAAPYRSASFASERVLDFGDTIVTVGLETVVPNQGAQAGQEVRRRITHVWRRDGGAWKLRLRHANVVQ